MARELFFWPPAFATRYVSFAVGFYAGLQVSCYTQKELISITDTLTNDCTGLSCILLFSVEKAVMNIYYRRLMEDYFQPIFEEVFGLQPQRTGLSSLLADPVDLQMDQSATPNPQGALPTPTTEPSSSSAAVRTGTESGLITPEEVSNITSSDAATVHSSDSGTPQTVMCVPYLCGYKTENQGGEPMT